MYVIIFGAMVMSLNVVTKERKPLLRVVPWQDLHLFVRGYWHTA